MIQLLILDTVLLDTWSSTFSLVNSGNVIRMKASASENIEISEALT